MLSQARLTHGQVSFHYDLPGNLDSRSNLVTVAPPQFQQSGPFYVIANSNGLLSVATPVTGIGPFTFQWLLNGAPIQGATNPSLIFLSSGSANLGSYQLVARNNGGAVTSAVVTASFDTDHSGLPDAWQLRYFGHLGVDPKADPDADGVSNLQEYVDGTDPTNPASVLPRLNLSSTGGGEINATPLKPKYQLNETVQLNAVPNPGNAFIGWSGSITNPSSTINLVMNSSKSIAAGFGLPLAQVLDAPTLVWTTGGDSPWFGQTNVSYDKVSAAQSGAVQVGQQSWLQTAISNNTLLEVTFDWAVSSASDTLSSGQSNYLSLSLNGNLFGTISGGSGNILWQSEAIVLQPAVLANVVTWSYEQNSADNDYGWIDLDTGWLDQVHVTPVMSMPGSASVVAWGDNATAQCSVPAGLSQVIIIGAGDDHSLALKSDGTVVVWGGIDLESNVPPTATNIQAIGCGEHHDLAVKSDGSVVGWGSDFAGQTDVPAGLNKVVAVAGGSAFSMALKSDGSVIAWGDNSAGQTNVPSGLSNVVGIACGEAFGLALKSDGMVVAWGDNSFGQTNLSASLSNVVAIAARGGHGLALQADGNVIGWGDDTHQESDVPADLHKAIAVSAGLGFSVAMKNDGTVVAWGDNSFSQTTVPAGPPALSGVVSVAAGSHHVVALLGDVPPTIAQQPLNQIIYSGSTVIFGGGAEGSVPMNYQWRLNGAEIPGATNAWLTLANVQTNNSGAYSVAVTNSLGSVVSSNATLTVVNSAPLITLEPASLKVFEGQTASFQVAALGSLPLSYQWLLNGINLPGASSSLLVITNASTSEAGTYQAVITNPYGSTNSSTATLSFLENASGVTVTNSYNFGSVRDSSFNPVDGTSPHAGLVLGPGGDLYGTTYYGGSNNFGTVFRFSRAEGKLTSLYSFGQIQDTNHNALDGSYPRAPLTLGSDGRLYGTTTGGGTNESGTVFAVTTNGLFTSLYCFGSLQDTLGNALDGADPEGGLLLGTNGSLYGTTASGGSNDLGTVFEITTTGQLRTLYSFGTLQDLFGSPIDGGHPEASMIFGPDGAMYGTTPSGGTNNTDDGSVFRITLEGRLTPLCSFGNLIGTNNTALDGASPYAPLALGADGQFYGTTEYGGAGGYDFGTVFRMSPSGKLTTLYSFGAIQDTNHLAIDGAYPEAGLVQGRDGNFYGTTGSGGQNNNGTVFQITPGAVLTTLYRFTGGSDGDSPYGSLVQVDDGSFYGTAESGGTNYDGVIFRLTLPQSLAAPEIQSATLSNGTLTLVWSTAPGHTYQLQYTPDWNQASWSNLGTTIQAAGTTASASDSTTSSAQKFYRVLLVQ